MQCMQAVRRQLPPPEGPCQALPSGRSQQPSPRPSSHPTHAPSKTPSSTTPSKCIAPEQYVAADEIFKVNTLQTCKAFLWPTYMQLAWWHRHACWTVHAILHLKHCSLVVHNGNVCTTLAVPARIDQHSKIGAC